MAAANGARDAALHDAAEAAAARAQVASLLYRLLLNSYEPRDAVLHQTAEAVTARAQVTRSHHRMRARNL